MIKPLPGELLDYGCPLNCKELVGFWPFTERSGDTIYDCSGYRNHLTLTNTVKRIGGKFGSYALDFDGGYLINTAATNLPTTKGSMSFWVNIDAAGGDDAFIDLTDGTANNRILAYQDANFLYIWIKGGGVSNNVWRKPTGILSANLWTHIVFTWNSVTDIYTGYVNGVLVTPSESRAAGNPSGITNIDIGIFYDEASYPLAGGLDNILIYKDRILNASEAQLLYQQPFCMIKKRRRIIYDEIAAAASAIPIFAHHYKMLKAS